MEDLGFLLIKKHVCPNFLVYIIKTNINFANRGSFLRGKRKKYEYSKTRRDDEGWYALWSSH